MHAQSWRIEKMKITDFTHEHIGQAQALAKANYEEERRFTPVLPPVDAPPGLTSFADSGLGAAAFENVKMTGFLCCYPPWDNAFGTTGVKGSFSPIHAHGAVYENREGIYKYLYQAAAEKWAKAGILSHAIGLYAHDKQAINSFFTSGFGLRTVDAVRPMAAIECAPVSGYSFKELDKDKKADTLPLKNLLIEHLNASPTFMPFLRMNENDLQRQYERNKPRYFTAYYNSGLVAWIEISERGENFICDDSGMQNICGAFCLPDHRGRGVYQNLLNYAIATLKREGCSLLGVDFESFNPAARGFWLKYFTPYTNGVVRRIDGVPRL